MVFQIQRGTDYGVRVMCHLAALGPGGRAKLEELTDATDVPASYLSKILQTLSRAGLITSRRGTSGGFALNQPPDQITLLDVITALEGPVALNLCLMASDSCHLQPSCPVHLVWCEAQERVTGILKSYTLDKVNAARPRAAANGIGPK